MSYIGDYPEDYATLNFKFTTVAADGTPTALTGGVVKVYADNETGTETVTGVTLTANFDSVTGLNNVLIDLSSDAFYATGKDYQVIITTGTVNGVSVVGYVVAEFSIENRYMRGTDGANTVVPDPAGTAPTAVEIRQEIDSNSTRLDADISSRAPANEYDTEMARITADVATEAKQDTMQADIDVILVDTGTTLPATLTTIVSKIDVIDGIVDAILVDTSTTLEDKLTLVQKLLKNKLVVDVSGSQMVLYDDDGVTPIYTWALTDKDDAVISVDAGVPTNRGVPS
jgi:hypothetical protein